MAGPNDYPILNYQNTNEDYANIGALEIFDIVITHYGCHDGISAGWVVLHHQKSIKIPKFMFINPSQKLTKEEIRYLTKKRVIVIDVSFSTNFAEFLKTNVCEQLVILDHHIGVADQVINYSDGIYDNNRCGAMMAWHYFYGTQFPTEFNHFNPLRIIDAYDRFTAEWKENIFFTQECFEGMRISGYFNSINDFDHFISDTLNNPSQIKQKMIELGSIVIQIRDEAIKEAEKKMVKMIYTNQHNQTFSINMISIDSKYRSQCGSFIAKKYPDFVSVIFRYEPSEDIWIMSARSTEHSKITALELAKEFAGNGHIHAAGFTLQKAEAFAHFFKKIE